jgi:hypothetical protein
MVYRQTKYRQWVFVFLLFVLVTNLLLYQLPVQHMLSFEIESGVVIGLLIDHDRHHYGMPIMINGCFLYVNTVKKRILRPALTYKKIAIIRKDELSQRCDNFLIKRELSRTFHCTV